MGQHRDAGEPRGEGGPDAHEPAEAHEGVGLELAQQRARGPDRAEERGEETELVEQAGPEAAAAARHEPEPGIVRRHPRVDRLAAHDEQALVAFVGQPLGQRDPGGQMAAGAAAGEQHAAHARASLGEKTGRDASRMQLRTRPTMQAMTTRLVPP